MSNTCKQEKYQEKENQKQHLQYHQMLYGPRECLIYILIELHMYRQHPMVKRQPLFNSFPAKNNFLTKVTTKGQMLKIFYQKMFFFTFSEKRMLLDPIFLHP